MQFVWFLLIGGLAGFLAGKLTKGSGFGAVGNLLVGVLGAVLGGFLIGVLGFSRDGGILPSLITATLGAILLLAGFGWLKRKK